MKVLDESKMVPIRGITLISMILYSYNNKLSLSQNVNKSVNTENDHFTHMEKLLDELVVGFDCSVPINLTSHNFETIRMCNEDNTETQTKKEKMQILQESSSFIVKAKTCSLRRRKKSNYCGNYDHGIALDSNGYKVD